MFISVWWVQCFGKRNSLFWNELDASWPEGGDPMAAILKDFFNIVITMSICAPCLNDVLPLSMSLRRSEDCNDELLIARLRASFSVARFWMGDRCVGRNGEHNLNAPRQTRLIVLFERMYALKCESVDSQFGRSPIYIWVFPEMAYTKFMITCMLHFRESYPESCPRIIPANHTTNHTHDFNKGGRNIPRNIPPKHTSETYLESYPLMQHALLGTEFSERAIYIHRTSRISFFVKYQCTCWLSSYPGYQFVIPCFLISFGALSVGIPWTVQMGVARFYSFLPKAHLRSSPHWSFAISSLLGLWKMWQKRILTPMKSDGMYSVCTGMCRWFSFPTSKSVVHGNEKHGQKDVPKG